MSDSTGWWYTDASGWYPQNKWVWIDGSCYYFGADGYMATSTYVDGCWVGADGAWVKDNQSVFKAGVLCFNVEAIYVEVINVEVINVEVINVEIIYVEVIIVEIINVEIIIVRLKGHNFGDFCRNYGLFNLIFLCFAIFRNFAAIIFRFFFRIMAFFIFIPLKRAIILGLFDEIIALKPEQMK